VPTSSSSEDKILAHDLSMILELVFSGGAVLDVAWVPKGSPYSSKEIVLTDDIFGVVYATEYGAEMWTPIGLGDKVADIGYYNSLGHLVYTLDSVTGMCYTERAYYMALEVPAGHLPAGNIEFVEYDHDPEDYKKDFENP